MAILRASQQPSNQNTSNNSAANQQPVQSANEDTEAANDESVKANRSISENLCDTPILPHKRTPDGKYRK